MMYVRVCACVGQTLLCCARGFPRGAEDVPPPPPPSQARDRFGKRGGAVERVHGDYTAASGPQMLQEPGVEAMS